MAFIPASNSVVAFQSKPSSLLVGASIIGVTPVNLVSSNASVVATISNSSITVLQGTNPWQINQPSPSIISYQAAGSVMAVSGNFSGGNSSVQLLNGVAAIGSVAVLQGTNPWQVNVPTSSYISYQLAGSVMAVSATVNTGNSSVQILNAQPSIIAYQLAGSVMAVAATVNTGNSSVQILNAQPSIIAYQLAGSILAVSGSFTSGNTSVTAFQGGTWITSVVNTVPSSMLVGASILGIVPVTLNAYNITDLPVKQSGTWVTSIVNTVPSSVLVGASIMGTVPVTQTTSPWVINMPSPSVIAYQAAGSVMAVSATVNTGNSSVQLLSGVGVIGSVTALQGTNPWQVGNSSVLSLQGTLPWVIQSIVGTYNEDAGHTDSDKGIFTLGVRNDTIASTASANLDYTIHATDSAGRTIIKPFVSEDATLISYVGSVTSTSVTLIAASVAGKKNYITDFWIANSGSVATIVQFRENTTSVIGTTIAPGGGGSNAPGLAIPIKTSNQGLDLSFTGLTATSILYVTVKGYQAP